MASILEQAQEIRTTMDELSVNMTDEQAMEYAAIFPLWEQNIQYSVGDRVKYNNELYKVIQSHKSQADWTPDVAVSLFVKIADPSIEWPDWVQPQGAHDAYALGAKVSHNGKHWISNIANNVWEPGVYGWDEQE